MKSLRAALCFLLLTSPALAGPSFTANVAKDAISEGEGGERKIVDGMEVWSNGAPPRRWELIGFLHDRRHKSGIYGAVRMSSLEQDIVKAARANGGDAVVLLNAETDVVAVVSNTQIQGNGTTFGSTSGNSWNNGRGYSSYSGSFRGTTSITGSASTTETTIEKENRRYAVIRYVDTVDVDAAPLASARDAIVLHAKLDTMIARGRSKYADFEEVVIKGANENRWPLSKTGAAFIGDSDVGAEVAYVLARDPSLARQVASLPEQEQLMRLEEIAGAIRNDATNAPALKRDGSEESAAPQRADLVWNGSYWSARK